MPFFEAGLEEPIEASVRWGHLHFSAELLDEARRLGCYPALLGFVLPR